MPTLQTYDDNSRREDLLDLIVNIAPIDTPMLSGFATVDAKNILHQWLTDTLAARAFNAAGEGADPTYPTLSSPSRVVGITQIFTKPFQVSDTERQVVHAGLRDTFLYQASKKLKELSNDLELAITRGSQASGDNTPTARQMAGILNCVTTNATAIASGTSLTEAFYLGHLQVIWNQGGDPDETYVGAFVKRQISGFTTNVTRFIGAQDRRQINAIDVYESPFGVQKIFLSRDMLQGASSGNALAALQNDKFRTAWLRRPFLQNIAKTGDSTKAQYVCEATLEYLNERSSGIITGILD